MSELREYFEGWLKLRENPVASFMLAHGRDYVTGPQSFAGERGEPNHCYMNATLLVGRDRSLTYVEGKILVCGVPIDHAWCVDKDGTVVEPTLEPDEKRGPYFGVPFRTEYVRRACLTNKFYGLLDGFYARKTAPKLYELGLEAGQDWLLNGRLKKKRAA